MKKYISLLFLLAASLPAFSQHFDWVKSYSGIERPGEFWNYIVSSVTDSHGNLYVAGQFANGASIDGQDLLLSTCHDVPNDMHSCIVKISPTGEILWKKILFASSGLSTQIYNLQLVGDTALFANAFFSLPMYEGKYLYFYDTLITKANIDDLLYTDSLSSGSSTSAISVFDLEGHMTENYIFHMAYKDNKGELITADRRTNNDSDTAYLVNEQFKPGVFHVDNQGNIYFGHLSTEILWLNCDTCENQSQRYDLNNGQISEVIVMINGRCRFSDAPITHPTTKNIRIMKFSPHFNDMLACHYIFNDNGISWNNWSYTDKLDIKTDEENNLFLICNIVTDLRRLTLFGDTNISANFKNYSRGMMIKFDSTLMPQNIIQLSMNNNTQNNSATINVFNECVFESDSNSVIILGSLARSSQDNGCDLMLEEHSLSLADRCAYFIRINNSTGELQSYGYVPSSSQTTFRMGTSNRKSVVQKNRIITHVEYMDDIQLGDSTISVSSNKEGAGIYMWDYNGDYIEFIDFGTESNTAFLSSSLSLHDSILYISGGSRSCLTVNDTNLCPTGNSIAFFFKYVDTSFMTPYVYTGPQDTGDVRIKVVEDGNAFVAYPNPFRQRVNIQVESGELKVESGVAIAWLTDMQGRREEVRLTPAGNGKYTLDLTSRPQATYLLTLTTATGKTHTIRLLKQSDIFSN